MKYLKTFYYYTILGAILFCIPVHAKAHCNQESQLMTRNYPNLGTLSDPILDSPKVIEVAEGMKHIGETVTVCSKVYGVKSTEKISFINLGDAYPNSPLTIVIFSKDLGKFNDSPNKLYQDKQVCVTGKNS